jgi:hypothetical protein
MSAKLFDDFQRTDPSPSGHQESRFDFLNRVDQPFWQRIREELERWYAEYPDDEHGFGLRKRFRRPEPDQHFGAWWELYLHRLFGCRGFEVEVEPPVPGGAPDFRMTRGDSKSFLVEGTTSFSGIVDEKRHPKREAAVLAAVDEAKNPNFTVRLEIEEVGDQPKEREIVEPLEGWLAGLDYDDVRARGFLDAPQWPLHVRGWKLLFTAFAVPPDARGRPDRRLLAMGPGMSGYVNDCDKLSAALASKGGKYKPEEPFVIAVLLMSDGTVDHEDIEGALLGREAYRFDPDRPGSGSLYRRRNGFWMHGNQPSGTRVSAVLTGNNLIPENVERTWPQLWPNPWAARPLTVDLPFPRGVANQQGGVQYEEVDGTPHSILGLPQDWPGSEPFSKPSTTG